jgi:hypothetical protein
METDKPRLMFIHGAWLSARSWETYADYFGKKGYDVSAPEWPRKHGDVEEMRETAADSEGLGVKEIVDHYEGLIRELDSPPVLTATVRYCSSSCCSTAASAGQAWRWFAPKGILVLPFSTLKAASPPSPTRRRHGVVPLTLEEFTTAS